jgi:hypothetical protein
MASRARDRDRDREAAAHAIGLGYRYSTFPAANREPRIASTGPSAAGFLFSSRSALDALIARLPVAVLDAQGKDGGVAHLPARSRIASKRKKGSKVPRQRDRTRDRGRKRDRTRDRDRDRDRTRVRVRQPGTPKPKRPK